MLLRKTTVHLTAYIQVSRHGSVTPLTHLALKVKW